jgi:hypothetical protein
MDVARFVSEQWQFIVGAPVASLTCAILFFGFGFGVAKLLFGTATDIARSRLETARDDLARLEKRKAEEAQDSTYLKAEVKALRSDLERMPRITVGTGPPPDPDTRKNGDIYIRVDGDEPPNTEPTGGLFLRQPTNNLKSALVQAQQDRMPIFAVVYNPSHPTRSKLAYSLGYFLEYPTTRKLVDEHFICALIPSTDGDIKALVPEDDPLENCRWLVLDSNGNVLRSESLYANPDEGLKRTREAIALVGSK